MRASSLAGLDRLPRLDPDLRHRRCGRSAGAPRPAPDPRSTRAPSADASPREPQARAGAAGVAGHGAPAARRPQGISLRTRRGEGMPPRRPPQPPRAPAAQRGDVAAGAARVRRGSGAAGASPPRAATRTPARSGTPAGPALRSGEGGPAATPRTSTSPAPQPSTFVDPSRLPPSRACPTRGSPITLITDGFPAAKARSSAGRISSGRVTCSPWQPIASNMRS